ncbi:MAG: 30S ribosomal protein S9 [Candidatus Aenigmarchaeota archaeon]|nr:30S ribosomal protein S9 [Candidatus Aenigmarchaeota archaeon]
MVKKEKQKFVITWGKRKSSVARAVAKPGSGKITINSIPLETWGTEINRMKVTEPLILAGDASKKVDIEVNVRGGGTTGQADAARMAIANALVQFFKDENLKRKFLDYDRNLLVADARRPEPRKPSRSKKGARRHKQRSKR